MQRDWNGGDAMSFDYMDICEQQVMQARPHSELLAEILDCRVAKNEREYAACREIERLRHDIDAYRLSLGYMVQGPHCGRLSDGTFPINSNAGAAAGMYAAGKEAYDALWKEKELLLSVLKEWQEFAADVRAGDAAGQDWLDELKARTARIVEPCS